MVKVKIKRFHEDAVIPKQATEFSGGWDVTVTEIERQDKDFVICKLGFGLQPPIGYKITLVPRSSLTSTRWIIQNLPGLGDADYALEYQLRFRGIPSYLDIDSYATTSTNELQYDEFPYKVGDRIGQIYIEEVIPIEWEEVDEILPISSRKGGYGSTN